MYIAYYRLKPKNPRLNLDAQKASVQRVARGELLAEFSEDDTKPTGQRPILAEAVNRAVASGATLVIAKLDRLVRNARVTKLLMESGVDFICCDNPQVNKNTIHILAAVADQQARETAQKTRETVATLKTQGRKFGSARPGHWKGREEKRGWRKAVPAATKQRVEATAQRYQFIVPLIKEKRDLGWSMFEIAKWLNDNGHQTAAMKPYTETAVWRLTKRYIGEEYLKKKGPRNPRGQRLASYEAE